MPHTCHWPSCTNQVPPKLWGCKAHWYKLPKKIRDMIWETYVPGQEIRRDPTEEYLEAATEADRWAREYEKQHGRVTA